MGGAGFGPTPTSVSDLLFQLTLLARVGFVGTARQSKLQAKLEVTHRSGSSEVVRRRADEDR